MNASTRRLPDGPHHSGQGDWLGLTLYDSFIRYLLRLSLNYSIRPRQHVRRNRQADLLGGLEIDEELELRRLLDGHVGGLGAFQDLVDKVSGAPE